MITNLQNIKVQQLSLFSNATTEVDLLRLDLLHPIVSGNKWFKLHYYLKEAKDLRADTIASFGGAYSNHIVATAFAAKEAGLKSMGLIRGDQLPTLSPTLSEAVSYGMQLEFISRDAYRNKISLIETHHREGMYWINEGGYGALGAKGAAEILKVIDTSSYTDILCATGTGTMLAGLISAALPKQQLTGISVLKNHFQIEKEIKALLSAENAMKPFTIIDSYHFGGYAKHPPELIDFMKRIWQTESVPTDIVYTSKLLFGAYDLLQTGYFPAGSRVLVIHSGGLQGNASLPPNTLPF